MKRSFVYREEISVIEGFRVELCSCDVPYMGARKAGTPCCCEVCGFMIKEQYDAIVEQHVEENTPECPYDCSYCHAEDDNYV
jgi:hypothetical protein